MFRPATGPSILGLILVLSITLLWSLDVCAQTATPTASPCGASLTLDVHRYSQSSVYASNTAASAPEMQNGSFEESSQTGTDYDSESWIMMDFGCSYSVGSVVVGSDYNNVLWGGWGKYYTENRNVQYSTDGSTWTQLFNTGTFSQGIQIYAVSVTARYIRIVAADDYLALTEFYALAPGASTPTPAPTPTFTVSPTTTPTSTMTPTPIPGLGSSTALNPTTAGDRKSFNDSASGLHWLFWYNGSAIEYASSANGLTWTSRGTLAYNTSNFSVAFKSVGGTSYVFLASEANSFDVVLLRGTISGSTIAWDEAVTALDGTSSSNTYLRPHVALSANSKVWISAFRCLGMVPEPYILTAVGTTGTGASTISFGSASSLGPALSSFSNSAMVPNSGDEMLLIASGVSGNNTISFVYNGTSWSEVTSSGEIGQFSYGRAFDMKPRRLAIDSRGDLYAVGSFTIASGRPAKGFAKWNGFSWERLGSVDVGFIDTLATDNSGNIYVGSYTSWDLGSGVSANKIMKWNGTTWSALGAGVNGQVRSLATDTFGNVYAGGLFQSAGGVAVNYVAKWNGSSWSALGDGLNSYPSSLATDSLGNVYAAGDFSASGAVSMQGVAKWNGTSWAQLGSGSVSLSLPRALAVGANGTVYLGAFYIYTLGGETINNSAAQWNGTSWSSLGTALNERVETFAFDSSGNLVAGGSFTTAGGTTNLNYLAKWNGTSWSGYETGTDGPVSSVATDASGNVYALGGMSGSTYAAKWNGTSWSALGTSSMDGAVVTLSRIGTSVYAGGDFTKIGNTSANNIAQWNGSSWSAVGGGTNSAVTSILDDGDGSIIVGGIFSQAGGVSTGPIARWNGTSWSAMGTGLPANPLHLAKTSSGTYYAMINGSGGTWPRLYRYSEASWSAVDATTFPLAPKGLAVDDSGNVYVVGTILKSFGAPCDSLAKWNGTSWSCFASSGLENSALFGIQPDSSGNLVVAGILGPIDGATFNNVAKWNGTSWSALGDGLNGTVTSLSRDSNGDLLAMGFFSASGSTPTGNIARWNGTSWSALGNISSYPRAVAVDANGTTFSSGADEFGYQRARAFGGIAQVNSSLVSNGAGTAYVGFVESASYVYLNWRPFSFSTLTWGSKASVRPASSIPSSVALTYRAIDSTLIMSYAEGGVVYSSRASSPFASWTNRATVSSAGSPWNVSAYLESSSSGDTLASWSRTYGDTIMVNAALVELMPTPTPTSTSTPSLTPTITPSNTPTSTPTNTTSPSSTPASTYTDTPIPNATDTPVPTATQTPLPTPTRQAVLGDLDSDLEPDAAFVTTSGSAEVVVNLGMTPVGIKLGSAVVAAGIGIPPGGTSSALITVVRSGANFNWNSSDVMTGAFGTFKKVAANGVPIPDCYSANAYTAAAYVPGKQGSKLLLRGTRDVVISLPAGTIQSVCGPPMSGSSTVFSLVNNVAKKTMNVIGKNGAATVINSQRIDPKLSNVVLASLPRAADLQPTVMILARRGTTQVVQVLDKTNKWQPLSLPAIAKGSSITAISGVRGSTLTRVVIQVTSASKATSYFSVTVPSTWL